MNYIPAKERRRARSKPQEVQAAEHYARLTPLDPHAEQRAELRAFGVGERRIELLYGGLFDAAARHILASESTKRANVNLQWGGWENQSYNAIAILQAMPEIQRAQAQDAYEHEMGSEIFAQLCVYLNAKDHTHKWRRNPEGEDGAIALWHACWFQQHRAELSPKNQRRADSLMAWVGVNMLPSESR